MTISTPKHVRLEAKKRYEPKTRSTISAFARTAASGTPTRSEGPAHTAKAGTKRFGRASVVNPALRLARARGVGGTLWKSGLDPGHYRAEGEDEDEGNGDDDEYAAGLLEEDSDVDERTLMDELLGLDDESEQNQAKRHEALTDTLQEHFTSLSSTLNQDWRNAIVPVLDKLVTTTTLLQKTDELYRKGFSDFIDAANEYQDTITALHETFTQLKDESLTRLKEIVENVEAERVKRAELCASFKTQYSQICSSAQDRLMRLATEDIDQAVSEIERRGNAIVNGRDKNKEMMRKQILQAFA